MKVLLIILVLILLVGVITAVQAAVPVDEASLNSAGSAFEVNPDSEGKLWISDFGAGEVWRVDPAVSPMQYTKYVIQYPDVSETITGYPSDARRDGGYFWWADGNSNFIGRASVSDGTFLVWQVPDGETYYGTAVDNTGRFWTSEWPSDFPIPENKEPNLVRVKVNIDGSTSDICSFSLPDGGGSRYIAYQHPYLWLGDEINFRIVRFNVDNNQYVYWDVQQSFFGLTVDGNGDFWFAGSDSLIEFDADTQLMTVFDVPLSGLPNMVAVEGNRIWYSGHNGITPSVGAMDSTLATQQDPVNLSPSRMEGQLTPDCTGSPVSPFATDSLLMLTGTSAWDDISYGTLLNADGWLILQTGQNLSDPWGIAYQNGMIYMVDRGRQRLVKFAVPEETAAYQVFLPLILR